MTGDWESAAAERDLKNAMDADPAPLVILPDPTIKLMPFVLGMMAMVWGSMASLIPGIHLFGRIALWALIVATIAYLYLTTVRRLVVGEDAVDIELSRKKARIPYAKLDYVTVRANPLGGALRVTFVTKDPAAVIRTRTPLMSNEVRKLAPLLVRALIIHGVAVSVPGRPDVSTR